MKRLFLLFLICLANVSAMPLYISATDGSLATAIHGDTMSLEVSSVATDEAKVIVDNAIDKNEAAQGTALSVAESAETEVVSQGLEDNSDALQPEVATSVTTQTVTTKGVQPESASVESISYQPESVIAEPEPVVAELEPVAVAPEPVTVVPEPVAVVPEPVAVTPEPVSNQISIAGRILNIVDVDSTLVDSGDHVNHFDKKFYYGHNSASVFGGIVNLGIGDMFSITYDRVTTTYRVAETVIYEKNTSNGLLQLNGEGDYMWYVSKARRGTKRYDVSLMTCYGTSYGNGDASHRFVIFANAM